MKEVDLKNEIDLVINDKLLFRMDLVTEALIAKLL